MQSQSPRSSLAWVIAAHALAGAALGGVESLRLANARIALALVPLFAAIGLAIGVACAITEWIAQRPGVDRRGWAAALVIAAPSLAVTTPVCATLFEGAYAQTLPLAEFLPFAGPFVAWFLLAIAVAIGKRLAAGDLVSRALPILALAGVAGAVMMARRKLGTGYLDAQLGATIAVIVIAGAIMRQARRARPPLYLTLAVVALTLGTASAALKEGLALESDRRQVKAMAGQARDIVDLWRDAFDRDGDNSSIVLGGGDCDDGNPSIYPGAIDFPGDGIDQDCREGDAIAIEPAAVPPAEAAKIDKVDYRWSLEPSVLLERTKGMNVVMITVDALRFDVLAPEAPDRSDFPRLVSLLDESVYFTRAIAPASGTDVSLGTLLTGRHDPFQSIEVTLPEAMRANGRFTGSALPGEVLRHVGGVMLGRGFEQQRKVHTDWETEDIGDHVSGAASNEEILRAIGQAKARPFFAWVHYFDVHEHHQIQPSFDLRRAVKPGASEVEHRYRAMLYAVDRSIGRLLDELDKRGLRDSTIIVFASDHGESLKEDPRLLDTHGIVAYGPLVRIPLALRIPGVAPGRRVDPVSLVDVAPTLLALTGAPHAMGKLDGLDLTATLLDGPPELRPAVDRALVIHEERQWSVVEWPYQLIVSPADNVVELYDLAADPAQRSDLAARGELPDVIRRLRARYAEVPRVRVDRTLDGRAWREQQALPPPRRAPP